MPDELDPQIKEFTSQLRRLVDRSGLSIAALADRTGYSKTSWERYLGGRLLAPKGAIVALAEVTGTNPVHLTTMWELAERAWSRAEMRHDRTMEQIRISQARAALGEFGAAEAEEASGTRTARKGAGANPTPGIAGPAGVSPTIPPQPAPSPQPAVPSRPTASEADEQENTESPEASPGVNSWGLAGYEGPSNATGRPGAGARPSATPAASGWSPGAPSVPGAPGGPAVPSAPGEPGTPGAQGVPGVPGAPGVPGVPNPFDAQPPAQRSGTGPSGGKSGGRTWLTMFLAGAAGVLVVVAAVFFFTHHGGGKKPAAAKSPSPTARTSLPPGVKCSGSACAGKDAEAMGCTGDLVTTAQTATIGTTTLEVRYSKACGAAWGRITGATRGDQVRISVGKVRRTGDITEVGDTIAYTPMVSVKDAAEAKACATLASGRTGCTK
ncbi:helix-turn-helix domain-containing protein [Streptomyces sp. NPDC007971]|uniref:helix-turn-helix domain-containing protein n=1 Tax=Streptomyces sp. NPDC007971 TaxID=3364799 RepID=UPI0036EE7C45